MEHFPALSIHVICEEVDLDHPRRMLWLLIFQGALRFRNLFLGETKIQSVLDHENSCLATQLQQLNPHV